MSDCGKDACDCGCEPRVPRVAHRLDDLAFGQWVAFRDYDEDWNTTQVDNDHLGNVWDFSDGRIVILADALAEPVIVPAEAVERLRNGFHEWRMSSEFTGLPSMVAEFLNEVPE